MKLKFYLRGLGIGIIVTALLMGIATRDNGEMSDAEIKARAAELGMVEQITLADIRDNAEPTEKPEETEAPVVTIAPVVTKAPDVTKEPVVTEAPEEETPIETEIPDATEAPKETEIPEATELPIETQAPEETQIPTETTEPEDAREYELPIAEISGDIVKITIYEGNHSMDVCRVLKEAGLIENASVFDLYLQNTGYSRIINTGSYKITIGTSEEEIARIITRSN